MSDRPPMEWRLAYFFRMESFEPSRRITFGKLLRHYLSKTCRTCNDAGWRRASRWVVRA